MQMCVQGRMLSSAQKLTVIISWLDRGQREFKENEAVKIVYHGLCPSLLTYPIVCVRVCSRVLKWKQSTVIHPQPMLESFKMTFFCA